MAQKPEFIQLEAGDDVASVRDRLSFHRGKRVLLIWPEHGTALTRKLDLVLVQREAMRFSIRLALVTHEAQVIKHAQELNISTFETIGASERAKWKRGRSKAFISRFQRPKDDPEPEELMPVASRVRVEEPERPGSRALRVIGRLLILLLLIGVTALAAFLLLPSATVLIIPAQDQVGTEAVITADPTLQQAAPDIENGTIPALTLRVEIEERGTIPTTGSQRLSATPASGTVVFINTTTRAITIPAGTVVSTSAGTPIRYRTTQDAQLSGGQGLQVEVPIEALEDSTGSLGNVDAGLINVIEGDLAESAQVRNLAPVAGGEDRSFNAVSEDDRDRLVAILRQQLQSRAFTEMVPRLDESQFIIPETVRISEERSDWMKFDFEVGDVSDSLTLTMRAIVVATAIDEQYAQQVAFSRLAAQIPRGRSIQPQTIVYERGPVTAIDPDGRISFTMLCEALVAAQVNVGLIQERLAGRSPEDALRYLETETDLAEGTTPQVVVSPEWFGQLPMLPMRINVRVQELPR